MFQPSHGILGLSRHIAGGIILLALNRNRLLHGIGPALCSS